MKILLLPGMILLLFACAQQEKKTEVAAQPSADVSYARNFSLKAHDGFTELQILDPEKGTVEKSYALVKRGTDPAVPATLTKIEVPLRSVVTLSGTHIGMLEKIGCAAKVSGVSSHLYISNPTVLEGWKQGKVREFEDFSQMNPESVLQTGAKVIVYSGFGKAPPNEDKLLKLGILCLPDYDWRENHPLGKAEWIKVFGYLFGKEQVATAYFERVVNEYKELKQMAAELEESPSAFSGSMIGDSWYMPAGESYGAIILKDAHCSYTAAKEPGTGSVAYSFEQTLKTNQQTDYWFNPGISSRKDLLTANARYRYFEAFKNDRVYCYSHDMNYFWENSAIEPQKVLSDVISVTHPGKIPGKKLYFYRKLEN